MGAHARYANRYPKTFAIFSKDDMLPERKYPKMATYLNAIVYNDFIVSSIIERFSDSDSIVIYFSDHGEEVYDISTFAGHMQSKISRFMVEIPFIIYVSDTFIQKHPHLYNRIKKAQNQRYMNDDLIHSILDIADININGFDNRRSILSGDEFLQTRQRIVGTEGIYKDYDKELK